MSTFGQAWHAKIAATSVICRYQRYLQTLVGNELGLLFLRACTSLAWWWSMLRQSWSWQGVSMEKRPTQRRLSFSILKPIFGRPGRSWSSRRGQSAVEQSLTSWTGPRRSSSSLEARTSAAWFNCWTAPTTENGIKVILNGFLHKQLALLFKNLSRRYGVFAP